MRHAIDHWDARTGGSWRYVHTTRARSTASTAASTTVGDDRLVQTFTFEGFPDGVALETMTFEDLGDGRTRLHATSLVDSFEGRDAMLASGMEVGVNDGYAKLDATAGRRRRLSPGTSYEAVAPATASYDVRRLRPVGGACKGGGHGPADQLRHPCRRRPRPDPGVLRRRARLEPDVFVPGEVLMIRAGDKVVLSLWSEEGFEAEVGPIRRGEGVAPITISHNVATESEVDEILALARSIGAEVRGPQEREWGGYTGYFTDPDGFHWEIATNPGEIGQVVLP